MGLSRRTLAREMQLAFCVQGHNQAFHEEKNDPTGVQRVSELSLDKRVQGSAVSERDGELTSFALIAPGLQVFAGAGAPVEMDEACHIRFNRNRRHIAFVQIESRH